MSKPAAIRTTSGVGQRSARSMMLLVLMPLHPCSASPGGPKQYRAKQVVCRHDALPGAERSERERVSERNRVIDPAYAKFRVNQPLEGWQKIQTWLELHGGAGDPGNKLLPEYRAELAAAAGKRALCRQLVPDKSN